LFILRRSDLRNISCLLQVCEGIVGRNLFWLVIPSETEVEVLLTGARMRHTQQESQMRAFIVAAALAALLPAVAAGQTNELVPPVVGPNTVSACAADYRAARIRSECGHLPLNAVFPEDHKWSEDCSVLERQIERICVNGENSGIVLASHPQRNPRRTIPYRPPQRPIVRPSHQPQRPVFQPPPRAPQHASHRPAVHRNSQPNNGHVSNGRQFPPPERRWAIRPDAPVTAFRCDQNGRPIAPDTPPGPGVGMCNIRR